MQDVLSTTRDAVLHVMKTAADGPDAGLPLDDIVAAAALPEGLADRPWLVEFFGKISWSVRAFAEGTLGSYDGNPTHLGTLSLLKRATHMAEPAGGPEALMEAAGTTRGLQWRLELCDHLIALGLPARNLKAETLVEFAEAAINAPARNTYIWEARRLSQDAGKARDRPPNS